MIRGISTELNQEEQINRLYGYIENSDDNAFYVANTLRKALLSDSTLACTVMGSMLAKHVKHDTMYDQDDKIIFHALESATDEDIRNLYRIMKNYKVDMESFKIPNDDIDDIMISSLDWCAFNRLFRQKIWGDIADEGFNTEYGPNSSAERLYEYIRSVKQVLDYKSLE